MIGDFVERNAVMNSIIAEYNRKGDRDGLKLAWIEKAVNEVPSALEKDPCDAVSREAAVNACLNWWNKDYKEIVADIRALPSVTPAEKVGHWEWVQYDGNPNIGNWHCSECHAIVNYKPTYNWEKKPYHNYCPSCGAKMEEVKS